MPLKLDVKRKFSQRSERVKGVDLHPTEPWILGNLYTGHVCIWNYADGALVNSFEAADVPARCAKFIPRKQWIVVGSDDMFIRLFNYNTMDRVKMWEAHADYIRSIAVHPNLPYILSCSDDMLIKLWDWDKGFQCTQVFEGHVHYVMQVTFNPKDPATFASASLDRTIKVWNIGQPTPNFTLEGHEKGVNCVNYFNGGDRPYLASGGDDKLTKIWDYQTKACVQTLEGHSHNVSAVAFHPELPIILTGSEDGMIKIWHATTYRLESSISYGMERVWAVGVVPGMNAVAVGYDEGVVLMNMGNEEPVASMDANGRIVFARHNEVQTMVIKSLGSEFEIADGERLPLPVKDLGSSENFPASVQHNANSRFVSVCGDSEYVVYTALAWRNKTFGEAADFAWSWEANDYATRKQASSSITLHKNFKESGVLNVGFQPEGIHGGALLAVRGCEFVSFYDWDSQTCVRRIDVVAENVVWNSSGDMLAIICKDSVFILQYHRDAVAEKGQNGEEIDDDGFEGAFDIVTEIEDRVTGGFWVGYCFVYTSASWRLSYCVGSEVTVMSHLDRALYPLGYIASQERVYLIDREFSVVSYTLPIALVQFKTLVVRESMEEAYGLLDALPTNQLDGVAKFLESRGHTTKALQVARDPEYRFELAISLNKLDVAQQIAEQLVSEQHWKQLSEIALSEGQLALAQYCLQQTSDLSGQLLLLTATGNRSGIKELCCTARSANKLNVAFLASFILQDVDACLDILTTCGRFPEATVFARTYRPSRCSEMLRLWKADLSVVNSRAAESLADPLQYPNLFPDWHVAMQQADESAPSALPEQEFLHSGEPVKEHQGASAESEKAISPSHSFPPVSPKDAAKRSSGSDLVDVLDSSAEHEDQIEV